MGRNTAKKLHDQGKKPVQKMEKKPVRTYKKKRRHIGRENWAEHLPKRALHYWNQFCKFPCKP